MLHCIAALLSIPCATTHIFFSFTSPMPHCIVALLDISCATLHPHCAPNPQYHTTSFTAHLYFWCHLASVLHPTSSVSHRALRCTPHPCVILHLHSALHPQNHTASFAAHLYFWCHPASVLHPTSSVSHHALHSTVDAFPAPHYTSVMPCTLSSPLASPPCAATLCLLTLSLHPHPCIRP